MRIGELLLLASSELSECGIVEHELDSRVLLECCLGKTRTDLFLDASCNVSAENEQRYRNWLNRRKKREPIAYIIGEQEFWSLPFYVSTDVLIPRPETEFLIDLVLKRTNQDNFIKGRILDLCCGSGVIATVLAKETGQPVVAADISDAALLMTKKNSRRHNVDHLVHPVQSNLFSAFVMEQSFSLVVTNPPYVSKYDVDHSLEPEVAKYEPRIALDGGDEGLEVIKQIKDDLSNVLMPGGQVFMEIGADQGGSVQSMFERTNRGVGPNYQEVKILADYTGRDRVLYARIND